MPYEIKQENDKFCVYNKQTGENKGCSDSHEMAVQHMRALYAHEPGSKSGPLSLEMIITKAEKTSQGFIRWRARCNTGEVDKQNERFDNTFWLDIIHNFMQVQKATSAAEKPALPVPILDVAHYSMLLGENRMKARAGWPVRVWVDGKALMAEGFYDDTPIGKASAAAGMRPEGKRPRISICVYPDWGNISIEDGVIVYKGGRDMAYMDHFAQTMYPVNIGTEIVAEVNMEKSETIAQDAAEVLGDEKLAKELEDARKAKSDTVIVPEGVLIKAEDTTPPAAEVVAADASVAEEQPVDKAEARETENTFRVRKHDPGDFVEGSFRTITIGGESEGIRAVIGHLKGQTSTTVQAYIFDKGKWTEAEAEKWIEKHKKSEAEEPVYGDSITGTLPVWTMTFKSEVGELSTRLDTLAAAFAQLSQALQPFMEQTSATMKSLQTDVEALKSTDTAKVKSAIDNGGDWLAKFYNPRKAEDNLASKDEVEKAEPKPQEQLDGIWGLIGH